MHVCRIQRTPLYKWCDVVPVESELSQGEGDRSHLAALHLWTVKQYVITLLSLGRTEQAQQFMQQVRFSHRHHGYIGLCALWGDMRRNYLLSGWSVLVLLWGIGGRNMMKVMSPSRDSPAVLSKFQTWKQRNKPWCRRSVNVNWVCLSFLLTGHVAVW